MRGRSHRGNGADRAGLLFPGRGGSSAERRATFDGFGKRGLSTCGRTFSGIPGPLTPRGGAAGRDYTGDPRVRQSQRLSAGGPPRSAKAGGRRSDPGWDTIRFLFLPVRHPPELCRRFFFRKRIDLWHAGLFLKWRETGCCAACSAARYSAMCAFPPRMRGCRGTLPKPQRSGPSGWL